MGWKEKRPRPSPVLGDFPAFEGPLRSRLNRRLRRCLLFGLVAALVLLLTFSEGAGLARSLLARLRFPVSGSRRDARTRRIWRSVEFTEGMVQRRLDLPPEDLAEYNITEVQSALRLAVVEASDDLSYSSYREPGYTILHFRVFSWDLPLADVNHIMTSDFYSSPHITYYAKLFRPGKMTTPYRTESCAVHWNPQCQIPNELLAFSDDSAHDAISVTLYISYKGRDVAEFPMTLVLRDQPIAPLSVCSKPSFDRGESLAELLEWREHHAMLGFEIVHWSHRQANFSLVVKQMNAVTGYGDTFECAACLAMANLDLTGLISWSPVYNTSGSGEVVSNYWDESRTHDDCYLLYRYGTDWMGLWDHDEYFSMATDRPWTSQRMKSWIKEQNKRHVGSVKIPYTWVNGLQFDAVPTEVMLEANPDLSFRDIKDIQHLKLNRNGIIQTSAPDAGMRFKSIHNARAVRHVWTHADIDRTDAAESVSNDVSTAIFHARAGGWGLPLKAYRPFPITKTVTQHWVALARRVRTLLAQVQALEGPVSG